MLETRLLMFIPICIKFWPLLTDADHMFKRIRLCKCTIFSRYFSFHTILFTDSAITWWLFHYENNPFHDSWDGLSTSTNSIIGSPPKARYRSRSIGGQGSWHEVILDFCWLFLRFFKSGSLLKDDKFTTNTHQHKRRSQHFAKKNAMHVFWWLGNVIPMFLICTMWFSPFNNFCGGIPTWTLKAWRILSEVRWKIFPPWKRERFLNLNERRGYFKMYHT